MRRPRGELGPRASRPTEGATCAGPGEPWSPSPNAMLRVLLSAQASSARLSGLLLLPQVQPYCLGPGKWGDRPPGGAPHAVPVQGLQRLLEQARSPGELLRWLGQNPTKVRAHHYPVALRRLGQLLGSQPRPPPVEQATLQDLSQLIIRNCPSFDIHTIHVCLHLAVLLGFPSDGPLVCALEQEQRFRLPPKPPPPLQPVLRAGLRLEAALSCPRFQRHPQHHLIRSLAEARPEELTPHVMVLLAQHLARHRLREPQLLEAIAHFLVAQEAELNSKVMGCSCSAGGTEVGPALWATELPASGTAVYALPREDPGSGSRGGPPGNCQHLDVTVPAAVSALPSPALCFFPRFHQPHQWHPSRPDCAALPLPARHGRGAGAPRISGSPPSPKATSAHLPPATHHRPCPLQVQSQGHSSRGAAPAAGGGEVSAGPDRASRLLHSSFSPCPADFLLCVSSSGAVLPVRTQDPFLPYPPRSCPYTTRDPAQSRLLLLQGGTDAAGTLAFLPGWQSAAGLTGPAGAASGPDGLPAPAATLRGTGVTERPAPAQELPEAEAPGPGPPLGA
ncbi:fas-activated serine/threonine kinase isoform X4 [Mesoplodon densirostris]|uniref:fas-activated serine/threonine kinase isoform X4 n=1 Tax=Mesoplodon densirostris TaxID=48708 RepID=UPI0028DCF6B2|nr:fas-activated serine/threonine kinase isoform X4 [Mesoplodon densirostris]